MDGYTGWEHPISVVPLYSDAVQFFAQAGTVYSNPFMFDSPTAANIEYWYAESDVWLHEKQRRWMPWRMTAFLRRRMLRPETDYSYPLIAQGLADIVTAGGAGALGGHGEHHGTSMHWEIWMAASGLGPLGALRMASWGGAYFLGAEQDIGSLEAGKLADLLVLRSSPLEDIRNTMDIEYVMQHGVLYEGRYPRRSVARDPPLRARTTGWTRTPRPPTTCRWMRGSGGEEGDPHCQEHPICRAAGPGHRLLSRF